MKLGYKAVKKSHIEFILIFTNQKLRFVTVLLQTAEEYASQNSLSFVSMGEITEDMIKVAYSGTCGEDLTWELYTNDKLVISGNGAMNNWSTSSSNRAPWYNYLSSIKTVIIKEGVTSIGNYAFYVCNYITSIDIPNSVTSIGESAFYK